MIVSGTAKSAGNDDRAGLQAVVALDPGREKCGLAVVTEDGTVLERSIVARAIVTERAMQLLDAHGTAIIAIGHSTQSREVQAELLAARPGLRIEIIDERDSTFEARSHYWAANPPRGWRRLLPLSLQSPPEPLDDWAAVVLAQRYFAGRPPRPAG